MLNYAVDKSLLKPLVPHGTELDHFDGEYCVSVVGFMFLKTRVFGFPIPFHRDFEEVNLRFYVRRKSEEGWRRGVVFVRELVPRFAIAAVARLAYGEKYLALPMSHELKYSDERPASADSEPRELSASYSWTHAGRTNGMSFEAAGPAEEIAEGSAEEFITEHYWGYAARRDGGTTEYQVAHPRWRVAQARESSFDADVAELYGDAFVSVLGNPPASAFLADGSPIQVFTGSRLS